MMGQDMLHILYITGGVIIISMYVQPHAAVHGGWWKLLDIIGVG